MLCCALGCGALGAELNKNAEARQILPTSQDNINIKNININKPDNQQVLPAAQDNINIKNLDTQQLLPAAQDKLNIKNINIKKLDTQQLLPTAQDNINIKNININISNTPQAMLLADSSEFHLILNRIRIEDLGAWLAFFDLGLDTGLRENLAGLTHIDYKIENGQLFRYAPLFGRVWNKEADCRIEELAEHLIVHFPRPHLAGPQVTIRWRVALFPHQQDKPLFLPADQNGTLAMTQASSFRWPQPASSNLHSNFSLDLGFMLLPAFVGQTWQSAAWRQSPFAPPQGLPILKLVTNLQSPCDDALWWPQSSSNQLMALVEQELLFARRLPQRTCNIVFPRPALLQSAQIQWLNRARAWANHRQQGHAIFIVDSAAEIPPEADAVLLQWHKEGDIDSRVKELSQIRQIYQGPLYAWMEDLLARPVAEKPLCLEAWLKFSVRPLLSPAQTLRNLDHKSIANVLWLRLLVEKKCSQWLKIPAETNLALYGKLLKQSPENYLVQLERDLREWYEHQNL